MTEDAVSNMDDLDSRAAQLAPMLDDADARVRKSCVIALGKMPCPAAVDILCRALDDADEGVGVLACQALGRIADPSCLKAVLAHTRDESAQMRAGVLWVLANVAAHGGLDDAARNGLFSPIVLLAFDPDDGVRADAAAVLGTIPDERAVDPLLVLAEDDEPRTRANALASLGLVGGGRGEEALLAYVEKCAAAVGRDAVAPGVADDACAPSSELPVVSALDALARRAERGEMGPRGERARRAVLAALALGRGAAPGSDVRATAVWSLGLLAPLCDDAREDVIGLLGGVLGASAAGTWEWRYAVESLSRMGGDDAGALLRAAREREDVADQGDGSGRRALLERAIELLGQ